MSLLFKTALNNVYKNKLSIFILFFFSVSGSSVYLSSDNLKKNIDHSLAPFDYASTNVHDFVISSSKYQTGGIKSYSMDDTIFTKQSFNKNLDKIDLFSSTAWKYKLNGNVGVPWVKSVKKSKSNNTYTPETNIIRKNQEIFILASVEGGYAYWVTKDLLTCNSTIPSSKRITFVNPHNSYTHVLNERFWHWYKFKWAEKEDVELNLMCDGNYKNEDINIYARAFWDFEKFFWHQNAQGNRDNKKQHPSYGKDIPKTVLNNWIEGSGDSKKVHFLLSDDQKEEINSYQYAKTYWVRNILEKETTTDYVLETIYFPFISKENYFRLNIPFSLKLNSIEINQKWQQLLLEIKNGDKYHNLSDEFKYLLNNNVAGFDLLKDLKISYFLSDFENTLGWVKELKAAFIPNLPSITFVQQMFLLHKLIMWDLVKSHHSNVIDKGYDFELTPKTTAQLSEKYFEELKKNGFEKLTTLIDQLKNIDTTKIKIATKSTNDHVQDSLHFVDEPFVTGNNSETVRILAQEKQLFEYMFDNIPQIKETYSKLKTDYAKKTGVLKFEDKSTSNNANSNNTLQQELSDFWNKWIKNSLTENEKKQAITYPKSNTSSQSTAPSTNEDKLSDFENVFELLQKQILKNFSEFIDITTNQKLNKIKTFINKNNLFKLSFLIYSFNFDKNLTTDLSDGKKKKLIELLNKFEINIHKSAVVGNAGNIAAKINDSTTTNHKFKLINQSTQDVNKLLITKGNPLFTDTENFGEIIKNYINNFFNIWSSTELAPLFRTLKKAKYSAHDYNKWFSDHYEYYSSPDERVAEKNLFISQIQFEKLAEALESLRTEGFNEKGSKISFEFVSTEMVTLFRTLPFKYPFENKVFGYLEQPSSYFGIVSPEYAKANNIDPISNEDYLKFKQIVGNKDLTQEEWEREYYKFILDKKNENSIININERKIIVVGIGQSPDFILPMHSWLSFIPDKTKESLVYLDQFGYKSLVDISMVEFFENYLSFKYPQAVKELNLEEEYLSHLNNFLKDYSSNNEFAIIKNAPGFESDDLFSIRSSYATLFKDNINFFSNLLLMIIFAIISVVIYILVKKFIQKNLNVFGNLIANGTSKGSILLVSCLFVVLPVFFASILGYVISLAVQPFIYSIIANFWFLPLQHNVFNIVQLLNAILKFLLVVVPIAIVAAIIVLKPNVSILIKENTLFKQNRFSSKMYSLLTSIAALWKFRFIIIFNAIGQTIILSAASIIVYLLFSFLFHNAGKIQQVVNAELSTKLNGYELDFISPTEQSGQYRLSSYYDLGKTFVNNIETKYNFVYNKNGKPEKATVTFNKDNPELVASNLNGTYSSQDFKIYSDCLEYLVTQNDGDAGKAFEELNKTYIKINPENLHRLLENKDTDHYLNHYYITQKKQTTSTNTDNACTNITKDYQSVKGQTKNINSLSAHPFKYSAAQGADLNAASSKKLFTPKTKFNAPYDYFSYIPRVDEDDSTDTSDAKIEKYKNKPLFSHLSELYDSTNDTNTFDKPFNTEHNIDSKKIKDWNLSHLQKATIPSQTETSVINKKLTEIGNFWYYKGDDNKGYILPKLSKLYQDNLNYWILNMNDFHNTKLDLNYFKNKVIVQLLLDHTFNIETPNGIVHLNLWNQIGDSIKAFYPELAITVDKNHHKFIETIIGSKYGKYFISRFMTKHVVDNVSDPSILKSHNSGDKFKNQVTYTIYKEKLDSEYQSDFEGHEGLYYIDSDKVFYFYNDINNVDKSSNAKKTTTVDEHFSKHSFTFILYRPDFLYLFFALMNDKEFLAKSYPPKFVFNYSPYVSSTDIFDSFSITGDVNTDIATKKGLVSEDTIGKYDVSPDLDQTYTYLNGNFRNSQRSQSVKIIGLKKDQRGTYIKLLKEGEASPINEKLYSQVKNNEYPIIINKFAAKYFNLKIGDVQEFQPRNRFDRYSKQLKRDDNPIPTFKLKVVDIYDSYFNNAVFISQKNANKILGLSEDYGYNGLFTKKYNKETPLQFQKGISVYSSTGIFMDATLSKESNSLINAFKNKPNYVSNPAWAANSKLPTFTNFQSWAKLYGLDDIADVNSFLDHFHSIFGSTAHTQQAMIEGASNNELINNIYFENISSLIINITQLLSVVLTPLLMCALLIITHLIIDDLKNLLVVLKLLGFTGFENSMPIFIYLLLILLITTFVGTATFAAGVGKYIDVIFNSLQILLPIIIQWHYMSYSLGILVLIFFAINIRSFVNIKNIYMPIAMKLLSD